MKLFSALAWWRWWPTRRGNERHRDTDPGDMGTAFGLDASLTSASENADPPRPEPRMPWTQRLVRRPQR